jgi:hypothetical protein
VARVDPEDDSILRYVVQHYRYDPERHERRKITVAAFDNEHEFEALLDEIEEDIRRRRKAGDDDVDPDEHASGVVHEPGYRRQQQNARLLTRALKHGVWPSNLDEDDLPASVGIVRVEASDPPAATPSWWLRLRRRFVRLLRLGRGT